MNTITTGILIALITLASSSCALMQKNRDDKPIYEVDCDKVSELSSQNSDQPFVIEFTNTKDKGMYMFWVNYEGEEELYTAIQPGQTVTQRTFKGHPWVARDSAGECIAVYQTQVSVKVKI